jgi:hypothetical protein
LVLFPLQHCGRIHVVDARTFETEEVFGMVKPSRPSGFPDSSHSVRARSASPTRSRPEHAHSSSPSRSHDSRGRAFIPHTHSPFDSSLGRGAHNPLWVDELDRDLEIQWAGDPDNVDENGDSMPSFESRWDRRSSPMSPPAEDMLLPALAEANVRHVLADMGILPRPTAPVSLTGLHHHSLSSRIPYTSTPPYPPAPPRSATRLHHEGRSSRGRNFPEYEADSEDVHLAGICFDPAGEKLYVASERAIASWDVRGAEKRWWGGGPAWA